MKLTDLLYQLIHQNRKIRKSKWTSGRYIYKSENNLIIDVPLGSQYLLNTDLIENTDDWEYFFTEKEKRKPREIKFEAYLYEGWTHSKPSPLKPMDIAFGKCVDEFCFSNEGQGDDMVEFFSKWEVTLKELK